MTDIRIFDTTLRDGEQSSGCSMNLFEKLKLAKQLETLKMGIVETGFPISSPGDFRCVQEISRTMTGRSLSTDIMESGLFAHINAVNNLLENWGGGGHRSTSN